MSTELALGNIQTEMKCVDSSRALTRVHWPGLAATMTSLKVCLLPDF